MIKKPNRIPVLLLLACLLVSCKPGVPKEYLQPGKMEDILYDYHVADGMTQEFHQDETAPHVYWHAVLKKHGVTEAEFDSSMVYYMRHTERLRDIYERLSDRLSDEALSLGTPEGSVNAMMSLSNTGDTANVWNGDLAFVLSTKQPYHMYSFIQVADSAYHSGDRLSLEFDAHFLFQDGIRDGIAVLALKYANDSVDSRIVHMSSSQRYSVTIEDAGQLGIKEIRGFFMLLDNAPSESATTLRLMFIDRLMLVRIHSHREVVNPSDEKINEHGKDSTNSSQPDSVPVPKPESGRHRVALGQGAPDVPAPRRDLPDGVARRNH